MVRPCLVSESSTHQLLGEHIAIRLDELLDEVTIQSGLEIVAREVMPEHVDVLVRLRFTDSPAEVIPRSKGRTNRVL